MARKVNTRFLVLLTIVVVGGAALLFAIGMFVKRRAESPAVLAERGKAMIEAGNYQDAEMVIGRAVSRNPRDAEMLVLLGQVREKLAVSDPRVQLRAAIATYRQATQVDPNNLAAQQNLLRMLRREMISTPRPNPELLTVTRETAARVMALDPTDKQARLDYNAPIVRGWLAGIATEPAALDNAVEAIKVVAADSPELTDATSYVTETYFRHAMDAARAGREDEAREWVQKAIDFSEESLKRAPNNALLHLRVAAVFGVADSGDPDPVRSAELQKRSREIIAEASRLADPQSPDYIDVKMGCATLEPDPAVREAMLRELLQAKPWAPYPRLALAELLSVDPARRNDAIRLLQEPLTASPDATGYDTLEAEEYAGRALLSVATIRSEAYASAREALPDRTGPDTPELAKEKQEILESVTRLVARYGETGDILGIRGTVEIAAGQYVEATQTLNRAVGLKDTAGQRDYRLMFRLAQAYVATGQTGEAKNLLEQIVRSFGRSAQVRTLLAQLYIRDNQMEQADEQLNVLAEISPDDPNLPRLRAAISVGTDGKITAETYDKLSEDTADAMAVKAQAAIGLGQTDEAERLLRKALATQPGDPAMSVRLSQWLASQDRTDDAVRVLDEAIAANPDDAGLAVELLRYKGLTGEQYVEQVRQRFDAIADPFERAMAIAQLERTRGNPSAAAEQYRLAAEARPDAPGVQDALFQSLIASGQIDAARALLPILTQKNADQSGGLLYTFRLAMAERNTADALSASSELTTRYPEFAASWVAQGQAMQLAGRPDDAVASFGRALSKQQRNPEALRGLIESQYAAGRPNDAGRDIARARETFPGDPQFRDAELQHLLRHGDPVRVAASLENAVAANPESLPERVALLRIYARLSQAASVRADGLADAKAYRMKSIAAADAAIAKFPDSLDLYALKAEAQMSGTDADAAQKTLDALAAREAWKGRVEVDLLRADVYRAAGQPELSEQLLRSVIATDDRPELRLALAQSLVGSGKIDAALEALPADSPSVRVVLARAETLARAGRLPEAETVARDAVARFPDEPDARVNLVLVQLDAGKLDDAKASIDQILAADARNARGLYLRAMLAMRQTPPDASAAINDLTSARGLSPNNVEARAALADAYRLRGETDSAIREISAARGLAPQNRTLWMREIDIIVSANPPRWSDFDRLVRDASGNAQLQRDPGWLATEARAWAIRGDAARASQVLSQAATLAPTDEGITRMRLSYMLQAQDLAGTVKLATAQIAADGTGPWWAYNVRGIAQHRLGKSAEAKADLDKAFTLASDDPAGIETVVRSTVEVAGVEAAVARIQPRLDTDPQMVLLAATLYSGSGDRANAAAMIDRLLAGYDQLPDDRKMPVLQLAGGFYLSGQTPEEAARAVELYSRLLKLDPNNIVAMNNLAFLLAESTTPPKLAEALALSQKAYDQIEAVGRFDPMIADTHGWMLVLNGKVKQGLDVLSKVVDRDPLLDARFHLAQAHLLSDPPYPQEAQRLLESALADAASAARDGRPIDPKLQAKMEAALANAKGLAEKADNGG